MKRALVAGGAGFIGSHFCELLLTKKYDVTIVDNLITGQRRHAEYLQKKGCRFIEADICDLDTSSSKSDLGTGYDEIYNLASPASPIDFEIIPLKILETGSTGHRNLLELAVRAKAKIFFASTSEVYGDPLVHPQVESYFGNVNPIGPRGCYDEAKRFGEALTMAYQRAHGVEVRIVRIFNTYGPRMRETDGRIIPNFFTQGLQGKSLTIYGDGSQTRSFCFVTDMCRGFYDLMQSNFQEPVNIGNPNEMTVLEMAETVRQLTGNSQDFEFKTLPQNDPKLRRPDITRATEVLKWQPQVSLESGLAHTLEFFKSNELKSLF